jgi:hypothetical protein
MPIYSTTADFTPSFDINIPAALGADANFDWRAKV